MAGACVVSAGGVAGGLKAVVTWGNYVHWKEEQEEVGKGE